METVQVQDSANQTSLFGDKTPALSRSFKVSLLTCTLLTACGGGGGTAAVNQANAPASAVVPVAQPVFVASITDLNGNVIPKDAQGRYLLSQLVNTPVTIALTAQNPIVSGQFTASLVDAQGTAMLDASGVPAVLPGFSATCTGLNGVNNYLNFTCNFAENNAFAFASGVAAMPVYVQVTASGMSGKINFVDTVSAVAPTLAANQPANITQDAAGNPSITISLAAYMQSGWTIVVDSVNNPNNQPGVPIAIASGNSVNISLIGGYGLADVTAMVHYQNPAGRSPSFPVTGTTLSN